MLLEVVYYFVHIVHVFVFVVLGVDQRLLDFWGGVGILNDSGNPVITDPREA